MRGATIDLQFGIDLGGTKTEVAALDGLGQIVFRKRLPTPANDYKEILGTIGHLLRLAEDATGTKAKALGVGAPGTPFGPRGELKNANTTALIGQTLAHDLQSRLAIPVAVENDANCLALSEASDGAAAGARSSFSVILGTGVGGALFYGGELINGPNRITGEWGHNALPSRDRNGSRRGRPCYCGLHDCIETFLCGQGLMQTFAELRKQSHPIPSPGQIVTLAAKGDPQALEALDLYYDDLSSSLASVVNIFDPEVIVLAGGLSLIPGITTEIATRINHHVFSDGTLTRIVTAMHGDSSGVRGAAWLSRNLLRL